MWTSNKVASLERTFFFISTYFYRITIQTIESRSGLCTMGVYTSYNRVIIFNWWLEGSRQVVGWSLVG